MIRVIVLKPFRYANRSLKPDDVLEMETFHAKIFETVGKVREHRIEMQDTQRRGRYARRDMTAEGSQE